MTTTPSSPSKSGWAWMAGQEAAIADPIPPTSNDDDRHAVKELIQDRREKLDRMKDQLKDNPLYEPSKHDDLWLVRFLLSHKNKSKYALKAAKHTLEFRKENRLDVADIRAIHIGHDYESPILPAAAKRYQKCCDTSTFRFVVHDRCVVSYVQWSGLDQPKLLKDCDPKDWLPAFAFVAEWTHQWLDFITRTTGRLTKSIRFVDLDGVGLWKNGNPKACHRDGQALNAMEDVYPQLLQCLFVLHAPFWVEGPWKAIKPLVPKRVLEKFDFLEPATKEKDLKKLTKFIDVNKLPSRFGGMVEAWPDDTPPPNKVVASTQ